MTRLLPLAILLKAGPPPCSAFVQPPACDGRDPAFGRMTRPTRRGRSVLLGFALALALAACSAPAPTARAHDGYCAPDDRDAVTVIVDYGDLGPSPTIGCAYDLPAHATGMDALASLGITVTEVVRTPQFICRIDGRPSPDQVVAVPGKDDYKETCVDTPPQAAYWTYWSADEGGQWTYSVTGYAAHEVVFGGYEGYSFAHNVAPSQAAPSVPPHRP